MQEPGELDPEMVDALRERAKRELRKRARALRAAVPASARAERSSRLVELLAERPEIVRAGSVALFASMQSKHEVDLVALHPLLRARGVRVAYPALEPDGRMAFREVDQTSDLVDRGHSFLEPEENAPEVEAPDVVIAPALLVDARGYRLGYGGGYYDRALATLRGRSTSIAVAFAFQLAAEVPAGPRDVVVDVVLIDDGRCFERSPAD